MGAYNPPEPAVTPVPRSLHGVIEASDTFIGVRMTDGSTRIVCVDEHTFPIGSTEPIDGKYEFAITASPGIHEQQPAIVPLNFTDTSPEGPRGYETIEANVVFTSYNYDQDEALANWTADMEIDGTKQVIGIANGDDHMYISVQ